MSIAFDDEIEKLFEEIDIPVHWRALLASCSQVSTEKLSGSSIRELLVPWYWANKGNGVPVCHDPTKWNRVTFPNCEVRLPKQGDKAITIGEAVAPGFTHPWFDEALASKHEASPFRALKLPAYQVGRKRLLLDGNHRTIGSMRSNPRLKLKLVLIKGPVDSRIIRDLAVFS